MKKREEEEGEDNKMLLHDMSITVIHFVWQELLPVINACSWYNYEMYLELFNNKTVKGLQ